MVRVRLPLPFANDAYGLVQVPIVGCVDARTGRILQREGVDPGELVGAGLGLALYAPPKADGDR